MPSHSPSPSHSPRGEKQRERRPPSLLDLKDILQEVESRLKEISGSCEDRKKNRDEINTLSIRRSELKYQIMFYGKQKKEGSA